MIESTGGDGAQLILASSLVNNAGGTIFAANGATVYLEGVDTYSGTLVGGTLDTAGTGTLNDVQMDLDGVHNAGSLVISYNLQAISLQGTIDNTGTISMTVTSGQGLLGAGAENAVLTGGGTVTLANNEHNIIGATTGGATLTNLDDTISGAGTIGVYRSYGNAFVLANKAAGVIDANGTAGLLLNTGPDTVTNAGLIEATGSGGLTIRSTSIDGSGGGVVLAGNGSHVGLQGATLIGGTLKSTGSGEFLTFAGANALNGTASAVNNQAAVIVASGTGLTLQGAINNTGKIEPYSASGAAALTIGAAGATLSGGGQVQMDNSAKNLITGVSSAATLTNLDNSINGAGQIGAGSLTLINQAKGVIVGSQAASLTLDTGANSIVNAGIILARGAGGVTIQSAVANSGILESDGGTLTINGAVSGAGQAMIYAGTLDFTSSFSQNVVFQKTTGVLELAQSLNYAGTVFGFSKTGGTSFDLRDIGFVSSTEATYSGFASGGVLTVTDGTHTATIALKGDYRASTFTASSDGHGGTIVIDPTGGSATAHRFVAAAASLGGSAGEAIHTLDVHSVHQPVLANPRVMTA